MRCARTCLALDKNGAYVIIIDLADECCTALRRTHEWPRTAPVDYAGVTRIVADHQQPGDAIVYSPRDSWLFPDLGLAYHLGARRPRDVSS